MRRFLRVVFVWLAALALPVQGFAGVAMLHCMDGPQAGHDHAVAGHDHAAHGHAHAVPHEPGPASVDEARAAPADAVGALDAVPGHTCSACAACCAAVALPATAPPGVAEPPAARTAPALDRAAPPRFITSGPERPPRTTRI
jgi:hypothetical protein